MANRNQISTGPTLTRKTAEQKLLSTFRVLNPIAARRTVYAAATTVVVEEVLVSLDSTGPKWVNVSLLIERLQPAKQVAELHQARARVAKRLATLGLHPEAGPLEGVSQAALNHAATAEDLYSLLPEPIRKLCLRSGKQWAYYRKSEECRQNFPAAHVA
jgi:hypothetical protein